MKSVTVHTTQPSTQRSKRVPRQIPETIRKFYKMSEREVSISKPLRISQEKNTWKTRLFKMYQTLPKALRTHERGPGAAGGNRLLRGSPKDMHVAEVRRGSVCLWQGSWVPQSPATQRRAPGPLWKQRKARSLPVPWIGIPERKLTHSRCPHPPF